MDKFSHPAASCIKGKGGGLFHTAPSPEKLFNRIIGLHMETCPWNKNITFGADDPFTAEQMISTAMTEPGQQKTYEVVEQFSEDIHAAGRIYNSKVILFRA